MKFVDTTLRDGHQSLIATRMSTKDMLPALEAMDQMGFYSMEVWGGATFDVAVRFLNEDPWERLRKIREKIKNTKLQMLLRGQNLVGYRHYADDTVRLFVRKAVENGIDIIRVFDALNDERNLIVAIDEAKKNKAHVQGAISYTVSPVHTLEYYVEYAKKLVDLGVDSLCIKDMAGLLDPKTAYELVSALKKNFSLPVDVHSHCTCGFAIASYQAAIMAGADIIDTALSPFALGTSQPPFEPFYYTLSKSGEVPPINWDVLNFLIDHFTKVREKYSAFDVKMVTIDPKILYAQVPGGMYSNLIKQLQEQKMLHKLKEVLEEIPRVQKDLGYPPLVTPTSQIVGVQAVLNVMTGERYSKVTREVKDYVKGLYGRPPAPIDPELVKKILGDEKPIDVRPGEIIEPEVEKARKELGLLAKSDEDVLIYIILGDIGKRYLQKRYMQELKVDFKLIEEIGEPVYPV
ncbi:pyruvate carboxylase subunit B [Pseudothermotoga thermarum]|uniref:Conserved carboxylase region n=1 Tax=Pseudothermotoga thermarum DSM 5069 TaxID=688269 RepID=F7YTV7_9THEM|nr:pyruvate carboxylase subunit B [Pseudothermotoga thermarum]AEH51404.1 Conserved carboxylase region [Pseudothermotoga thermarum DSM 5069]